MGYFYSIVISLLVICWIHEDKHGCDLKLKFDAESVSIVHKGVE